MEEKIDFTFSWNVLGALCISDALWCVGVRRRLIGACLSALPFLLSPSDQMNTGLETYIICNRYHCLMVFVLPLAAHNGASSEFICVLFSFLMVTEWGQCVTWEGIRTRGSFIYLSESWHRRRLTWCAYWKCLYWLISTRRKTAL